MKFGGINFNESFGSWEIENLPVSSLPEQVATALGVVNAGILGATYYPIRYMGKQLVNGWNYFFLCKQVLATADAKKAIVGLIVNIPAGDLTGKNASVVRIIEEAELPKEVEAVFKLATAQLLGVNYVPLIYVGDQVVKGKNYYIICSATPVYPDAEPYAVLLTVNLFGNEARVVGVEPIEDVEVPSDANKPQLVRFP